MKISHRQTTRIPVALFISLAAIFFGTARSAIPAAQPDLTNSGEISTESAYHVIQQDANSRVWERTATEHSASGELTSKTHRYVELATGLNHWKDGQWVESQAKIDLLPDGRAAAIEGQHQCYFPADIGQGVLETVTADGLHLKSRPVGLSYSDGAHTVLIARLRHTTGQIAGANQVIYADAFTGLQADLRYTYTIAGIEQDVILRSQPPAPEALGLNPQTTRLQILTEFIDTPEPRSEDRFANTREQLTDHQLTFGAMKMVQGRAFSLDDAELQGGLADSPVYKSWHHEGGRSYLAEEVPLNDIQSQIDRLPAAPAAPSLTAAGRDPYLFRLSPVPVLPPSPAATGDHAAFQIARAGTPGGSGFVLDYILISYTVQTSGYVFRGDTTYFLSNAYFVDTGVDTIEGGTVIKFDRGAASLNLNGPQILCETGPYQPAIFTAKDDDSVGEVISGSTGSPSGYYGPGNNALYVNYYNENLVLHDLRMSWLNSACALWVLSSKLQNVQFVNCGTAVKLGWCNLTVNNALFANVGVAVADVGGSPWLTGNFVTAHNCGTFGGGNLGQVALTDSLLVTTTNFVSTTNTAIVTNDVDFASSDAGVFQTAGAGAHYLVNNSPYRNAGTTNVDPTALADITARTTFPPVILSGIAISSPTNLPVLAQRDTDTPDLGYHYDPLDYITDGVLVNNTALGLEAGVAVACYNRPGITLQNGGSITSTGTPTQPNWLVRYQSVQEQSINPSGSANSGGQNVVATWSASAPATGSFLFTHFAAPAAGGIHFNDTGAAAYGRLTIQNSELWGGTNVFSGPPAAATTVIENDLFHRSGIYAAGASSQASLSISNTLFYQSPLTLVQPPSGSWTFFDNEVDGGTIAANSVINSGYNAYINCPFALGGPGNLVTTNAIAYQAGPLGAFYQPPGSPLVDAGSTAANLAGYYHFTTQINESKETNSPLDIGYHYVAVDTNGNPVDSNNNGIPDYLEDANGNGLVDNGEQPWMAQPVFTLEPTNEVFYPGGNIVFATAVTGQALNLQWYFNSTPLPGQTNAVLLLNNVSTSNLGAYYLAASNGAGSVNSASATLALLTAPVIVTQPASQTGVQTGSAIFNVMATGFNLCYQWYSNSVPLPGATGPVLPLYGLALNSGGSFYVVVTNQAGSATSSTVQLTVTPINGPTVIYAASGQYADVSNAVAQAQPGNLVLIPPCTNVWSQTLYLNGVSLRGCGTNQTVILDGVPPTSNNGILIEMNAGTNGLTQLSNFQITCDPTNMGQVYNGVITAAGSPATPWRIDHMFFNNIASKNIGVFGSSPSVIDHNLFFMTTITIWEGNYGDQYASWAVPATWGLSSSNELYIEDNYFTNTIGVPRQVCDGCGGARFVLRYNTICNDNSGNHGTETGGDVRSQRSMEIYENTFNYAPWLIATNGPYFAACLIRGGSGIMFSNIANGYQSLATFRNFRSTDTFGHGNFGPYYPYGGANGANAWDSNNPAVLLQGTHTGPNGANYLQVAGANWATNQWVGCTLNDTNTGIFSEVVSNNANTMYYIGYGIVHSTVLTFNTGDSFALYQVYATIDQIGRGSGDLLQYNGYDSQGNEMIINTTTGQPSWPHEVVEPWYFWGNSLNGITVNTNEVYNPYPTLQMGRDYICDTPMPGYTPYPYPHPLTKLGVN